MLSGSHSGGPRWAPSGAALSAASPGTRRGLVVRTGDQDAPGLAEWCGADTVVLFEGDAERLHLTLALRGPFDLLVDASGAGSAPARLRCVLHHLRTGGTGLVRLPPAGSGPRARLDPVIDEFVASGHAERAGESVVLTQATTPLSRLADDDLTAEILALRAGLGRVHARRPAAVVPAHGSLRSTRADERPVPARMAPELVVREYHEVTCGPRSLVTTDGLVLPDSFRWPERPHLDHPHLERWDARTSVPGPHAGGPPGERLAGRWFHADNFFRGHFGHAMTEQISKFWAWPDLRKRWPDLGVLVSARPGAETLAGWEVHLLEAIGVPRGAIHLHHAPVTVEHLVAATPGFAVTGYLHPAVRPVYDTAARALASEAPVTTSTPDRIFLTRAPDRRGCRNAADVYTLVERFGFTVLSPEELSLPEQVAHVRGATVVAGFGGSAMLHIAMAERAQRVLVLSHDHYHCANEKFLSGMRGHDLSIYRSVADQGVVEHGSASFHSSFSLDFDREGRQLLNDLEAL